MTDQNNKPTRPARPASMTRTESAPSKASTADKKPSSAKPTTKSSSIAPVRAARASTSKTEPAKVEFSSTRTAPAKSAPVKSETAKPMRTAATKTESVKAESAKPARSAAIKTEPSRAPRAAVRTEQPAKVAPVKTAPTKSTTATKAPPLPDKTAIVIAIVVAAVLTLGLIFGLVFGIRSCSGASTAPFANAYAAETKVGYSSKQTGTVKRVKPVSEIKNGGLPEYPVYGKQLTSVLGEANAAKRNALIAESSYLTATGTWNGGGGQYTWMDKDGYLYSGSTSDPVKSLDDKGNHRQLYKHTAAVGLYGGDVADNEPGIVKEVTMQPRGYTRGYGVTGVYAPAGEVIKIEISEEDMNATGGIVIHIGQALYNGKANNIWTAKNQMQRFPVILNTMSVTKDTSVLVNGVYTAYVGSFVGGPLYIRNETVPFKVTISGGVKYAHFILGYTTEQEYADNFKSSAPYFDLEVWEYGVLHSGPKAYAKAFSYDQIYKAAVLWEKVSLVSTTNSNQGIVFLYDPFVAAGAAVAFPGQGSVNCPAGWMSGSLNYDAIVKGGSWGNFHEYHHNFQGYGVGAGGEVTNNGMTLVSYALFTKISAARGLSNFGAAGLGGWNNYTVAPWALEQVNKIARANENPENGNMGLALYATLLHNFGADNYMQAKVRQQRTGAYRENYAGYLQAWQDVTHNDMSYYFNNMLGAGLGDEFKNPEYPLFVPASSTYQTGRSYMYDGEKKYIKTMQPYVIPYGEQFTVDLRPYTAPGGQYKEGSIVVPDDFKFTVKNVQSPEHGSLTAVGNGTYTYTPDTNLRSGEIIVTLSLTHRTNPSIKADDIDIILEFEQTHEKTKTTLTRTTYEFTEANMYADAQQAYESNFKNFESKVTENHTNPTQNCNTDIWYYIDTPANRQNHPLSPDSHFAKENTIAVVEGKIKIDEEEKYRFFLRGRLNCALYYSLDEGKTYKLGATIKDDKIPNGSAMFRPTDSNTYFDLELPAHSWVYFKEVLVVQAINGSQTSYIGMGMAKWTKPMFTMVEDDNGKTHYYNYLGIEVSEEVANSAELMEPVVNGNSQPYVNAYRTTYEELDQNFEADYFYTRNHAYNYTDNEHLNKEQEVIKDACIYTPWGDHDISMLTDGNRGTWAHTRGGVSEQAPAKFVVDMKEAKTINRMVLYSQPGRQDPQFPKNFTLRGSLDGNTWFDVGTFTDVTNNNVYLTVDFPTATFRYYELNVTASTRTYVLIAEIEMWRINEYTGATQYSPDNKMFDFKGKWTARQANSSYGHVYVGKKGASVKFEFEGARLAILSTKNFGTKFEVFIDGKKVRSVPIKSIKSYDAGGCSFMSDALTQGKHKVEIKCTGEANIDSIAIYP